MKITRDIETQREPENVVRIEPLERGLRRVALQEPEVLSQRLAERPVRSPRSVGEAASGAPQRFRILVGEPFPELARQPRLADAYIAENGHEPRAPLLERRAVGAAEPFELPITADERSCKAADSTRPHQRERAHEASRDDSFGLPLRGNAGRLIELERDARRPDRALADEDCARRSSLLQPSGDVHDVTADERASRPSRAARSGSGVQADTQCE